MMIFSRQDQACSEIVRSARADRVARFRSVSDAETPDGVGLLKMFACTFNARYKIRSFHMAGVGEHFVRSWLSSKHQTDVRWQCTTQWPPAVPSVRSGPNSAGHAGSPLICLLACCESNGGKAPTPPVSAPRYTNAATQRRTHHAVGDPPASRLALFRSGPKVTEVHDGACGGADAFRPGIS